MLLLVMPAQADPQVEPYAQPPFQFAELKQFAHDAMKILANATDLHHNPRMTETEAIGLGVDIGALVESLRHPIDAATVAEAKKVTGCLLAKFERYRLEMPRSGRIIFAKIDEIKRGMLAMGTEVPDLKCPAA